MSLHGDDYKFHIIVHEYDESGQCTYVDAVGRYNDFDDAVLVYSKYIATQWSAVDPRSVRYDFELVESSPMSLYHPHGCTPRIEAKTGDLVYESTVAFSENGLLTST